MLLLYGGGLTAVLVVALSQRRRATLVALPVVLIVTLAVNPGWLVTPRTWFTLHRPLLDRALRDTGL
ncbi:hypothetical protein KIH27_06865 [Mycobacterium sp. M1]|uniref:Uncharacterized protein n=1 Tax=Mycolicibacter acidiphilus TaxID=2835306 RepID=A0ABS5RGA2_9MYCO|nr:hypothetical protein [Mycolicibacter acidiphilus]MBS9533310.1 hypothetical protein [Mycolicibacter acidiphilus]